MKVLLVGFKGQFTNSSGAGIDRYVYELYKNLMKSKGLDLHKKELSALTFNVSGLHYAVNYTINQMIYYLKSSFLPTNFNIIHYPSAILAPHHRNRNILALRTIHDFGPVLYPEITFDNYKYDYRLKLLNNLIIKRIYNNQLNADYFIADSSQTRDEAIRLGIEKDKISVINLGVDNRFLIKRKKEAYHKIFNIGYIGAITYRKNTKMIIETAKHLHADIPVNIYGNYTPEYFRKIDSIAIKKNIHFKGFAPEYKLVDIYDSFDVFTFPSLYEGFGLPILEAQARGLPVIIYKYGKIPKEVRKYCFEAESPEHMAQIIMDLKKNGYNEKLQKRATEYARTFTWEKCARETIMVYKRLLEK